MTLPFHRWHPQLALRYLPLVRYIKRLKLKHPQILEVGSGSLGIGPYLRQPFTGVDVDFSGPFWSKLKKVKASAEKLPFKDNYFDIVLSVDVLEHLPSKKRQKSINEIIRVAKDTAIIAVPCGQRSHQLDQELDRLYRQKFGRSFPFLKEHLQHDLPEEKEVSAWLDQAAKKCHKRITVKKTGNRNLRLRRFLMRGWMTKSILVDIFFRKILLLFLPLLSLLDQPSPHYRQIFFISLKNPS